jgi:hypothetical protein
VLQVYLGAACDECHQLNNFGSNFSVYLGSSPEEKFLAPGKSRYGNPVINHYRIAIH